MLQAYGAELIFTDPLLATDGAQIVARELSEKYPEQFCYLNQYANPANVHAHLTGTGPEIWRQTEGAVTHFVLGLAPQELSRCEPLLESARPECYDCQLSA